jgi:hypothetical protein
MKTTVFTHSAKIEIIEDGIIAEIQGRKHFYTGLVPLLSHVIESAREIDKDINQSYCYGEEYLIESTLTKVEKRPEVNKK